MGISLSREEKATWLQNLSTPGIRTTGARMATSKVNEKKNTLTRAPLKSLSPSALHGKAYNKSY
jgi:hypothetical protein